MSTTSNPYVVSRAARDIVVGNVLQDGKVTRVDATTTPGVIYLWLNGSLNVAADVVLNHGDPVKVYPQGRGRVGAPRA